MKKSIFTKERLIHYLLIVSVFSVTVIGLYVFKLLTNSATNKIFSAFASVFIPFVIAFFLSFIIGPISGWLTNTFKIKSSFAVIIAIFIGIVFFASLIVFVVVFLVGQLSMILSSLINLIDNETFRSIVAQIETVITNYVDENGISKIITELTANGENLAKIISISSSILAFFINFFSSLVRLLMTLLLTPVFLYYLIREKEQIFSSISGLAPKKLKPHLIELGKRSDVVIRQYFAGQGIMMLLVGGYFFIGIGAISFFVPGFGLQHALLFAILLGLMNIIPYLGAWIGLSVPLIYLVTRYLEFEQAGKESTIFLIAIGALLVVQFSEQILESNIVSPQVMGKHVRIHPLVVLSSLIFFGGVFGFVGVLLAVPIAGTIKVVYQYIRALYDDETPPTIEEIKTSV
ncbi:MAG TPA: AI-2E family transporter [Acholeplasma sp.]|nr:AI-2E family transporter [Acholeplasma sp.]